MRTIRIRHARDGGEAEVTLDVARHMVASGHAIIVTGKLASSAVVEVAQGGVEDLDGTYLGVIATDDVDEEAEDDAGSDPADA